MDIAVSTNIDTLLRSADFAEFKGHLAIASADITDASIVAAPGKIPKYDPDGVLEAVYFRCHGARFEPSQIVLVSSTANTGVITWGILAASDTTLIMPEGVAGYIAVTANPDGTPSFIPGPLRASLWDYMKSKIDLDVAFLGTKNFGGQVELSSQSALTPTSALNIALGDLRYIRKIDQIRASVTLSVNQLMVVGVYTKVNFDIEDYDVGSCLASGQFTAQSPCQVSVNLSVMRTGGGALGGIAIFKNGVIHKKICNVQLGNSDVHSGSAVINCELNDILDIRYIAGNPTTLSSDPTETWAMFTVLP